MLDVECYSDLEKCWMLDVEGWMLNATPILRIYKIEADFSIC